MRKAFRVEERKIYIGTNQASAIKNPIENKLHQRKD